VAEPQGGIIPEPSARALFLILRVLDPSRSGGGVAGTLAAVPSLVDTVGALDREARLVCTVGVGSEFWDRIARKRPRGLRPFKAIEHGGRRAPNTGGDLLFHAVSSREDLNFELAMRIMNQLGGSVTVMEEVHGFRYLDSRDLTGFIDGTENPKGAERADVALIGDEDPDFAGGSYAFTQRYVHDLKRWAAVPQAEQEATIGRRKTDSEELETKPPTAHISRVVIEEDGRELEIVRHSFPYGTVSESGLFFIAYSRTLDTTEKMLSRMMGTAGDGLHDHLMDYTRAVSGATFFAPSLPMLRALGSR
jgi:putative iron-dependent peroxidase